MSPLRMSALRQPLSKPLLLAVVVMLGLSLFIVADRHRAWSDVQRVVYLSDFIAVTGDYVHELQIERGLSALYLGGGQDNALARLNQQRIQTDSARTAFYHAISGAMATGSDRIASTLQAALAVMRQSEDIRARVDGADITPHASFDYYSDLIAQLFKVRQAAAYSTGNSALRELIAALNQLNHIKELSGQIRALGSEGFASGKLPPDTHQQLVQLVGIQNEHLAELPSLISPAVRAHLDRIHNHPDMALMTWLRQMLMDEGAYELPRDEALTWFETTTTYIDKLKEVENRLIDDLQHTSMVLRREMTFQFYGLIVVLGAVLAVAFASLWRGQRQTRRIREDLEASLQAEQTRSSQILEAMTDAVCVVGLDGKVEYANPAMQRAFGKETLSKNACEIMPCVGSEGCALSSQGLLFREGKCGEAQSPISGRGYSVYCTSFYTREKRLSRLVVMNDVTAHMMAEQRLIEAKEAAECANRTKSEIMANMSHELRTPLNAIIGFSDMMLNSVFGRLGNEQYVTYARDIHESGKHLLDLINDILDVSAIEAGRVELQKDTVNVDDVVGAAVRLVMPRAFKGQVEVQVDLIAQPPLLHADGRRLKQILLNLLSNAVKFTPPGGRVIARTANAPDGAMTITVTDTGVGMTPEEVEIAFEPFGQADSGLDRKHEGTGLGLPLTKGLVELHGGSLEVRSEKGLGTSIVLTFPPDSPCQIVPVERDDNAVSLSDANTNAAASTVPGPDTNKDMLMTAAMAAYHAEDN